MSSRTNSRQPLLSAMRKEWRIGSPKTRRRPAVAHPATLPSNTMAVVRTTFEMKKPRIAVLNEGPCGLAAGARGAEVMVVHLLVGSQYRADEADDVRANTRPREGVRRPSGRG